MAETTAETLRKIVALCGPVLRANGGVIYLGQMPNQNFLNSQDEILAHARRVLREKHVLDVRWGTYDNRWYFGRDDGEGKAHSTEAECILAALESVQPKEQTPRFCSTSACDDLLPISDRGTLMRASRVADILNATQDDIDEAVAAALENVASMHESEVHNLRTRIAELRKGGAE